MRFLGGIFACLFVLAPAAFAETCVPQKDMQQIAERFPQFQELASTDYCYDGSHTAHLIEALEFMRKTPYTPTMPKSADDLFSGTFSSDWFEYFTGRITDFNIQEDCPKGVGAFVYFFANTMFVCPMLLTDNFTALDRTSVMMHEARHIDGFPHMTCTRGPRAGVQGACDRKISDHGSYAVTVETFAQLSAYALDLHPALKAYARSAAVIYADEAFETPTVIDRAPQFLLMTSAKEFYRLESDGSAVVTRLGDAPALGHIVMRSKHMILFPDDKTLPAKFVFARNEGEIRQTAGDLAAEYNSQTPQQRADLVDIHVGGQWSARVYKDRVRFSCDPNSAATEEVALTHQPAGFVYPKGYDRVSMAAQLLLDDSTAMEVGCENSHGFVRTSDLKLDHKYKRVYKSGNEVLGLSTDGRLYRIEGTTSSALQTEIDGRIHELVPSESFRFFEGAGS